MVLLVTAWFSIVRRYIVVAGSELVPGLYRRHSAPGTLRQCHGVHLAGNEINMLYWPGLMTA